MTSGPVISSEAQIRGEGAAPTENKRFPVVPWLDELLFSLIVLGDDRVVERTVIAAGT